MALFDGLQRLFDSLFQFLEELLCESEAYVSTLYLLGKGWVFLPVGRYRCDTMRE